MLYKASTSTNTLITEKMGTAAPLAIGTRGTVGSLLRREIEYFRRVDVDRAESSKKPESRKFVGVSNSSASTTATTSSSSQSKIATLGSFLTMGWRRKRRRISSSNSNGYLPSMCSAVEVSESKRFDGIPGFSYKNLKADIGNTTIG